MPDARRLQDAYKDHWEKAANDCKYVKVTLEKKFPGTRIEAGHGALSKDYDFNEHEKGSPDLFVYDKDNVLVCSIEVTGSDRLNMRPGMMVWIRPDKVEYMKKYADESPVFAFFVYRNCECTLSLSLIEKHNIGPITVYPRGPGYPETFIQVPFNVAVEPEWLYKFISMNVMQHSIDETESEIPKISKTFDWGHLW